MIHRPHLDFHDTEHGDITMHRILLATTAALACATASHAQMAGKAVSVAELVTSITNGEDVDFNEDNTAALVGVVEGLIQACDIPSLDALEADVEAKKADLNLDRRVPPMRGAQRWSELKGTLVSGAEFAKRMDCGSATTAASADALAQVFGSGVLGSY